MSCAIEKMSWSQIIDKYKVFVYEDDVYLFITPEANEEKQDELRKLLAEVDKSPENIKQLKDFLDQNEKYFDKLKYVMTVNLNAKLEMAKIDVNDYDRAAEQKQIIDIQRYSLMGLKEASENGEKKSLGVITEISDKDRTKNIFIATLDYLIDGKRIIDKRKSQKKNIFVKSDISLADILYQSPEEIFDMMEIDEIIKATIETVAVMNLTNQEKVVNDELIKEILQERREEYIEHLVNIIEGNMEFLDLEGLLIGSISINLEDIDNSETSEEEKTEIFERLGKMITLGNKIFQKGIAESPKNIQKFNELKQKYKQRMVDGIFITKDNIQIVLEGLKEEKYNLGQLSASVLEIIGEIPPEIWLKNKENFKFAMRNNYAKDKSIYEIILENRQCSTEIILDTLMSNMISKEDVIDLYMQKAITLEQVRSIEENLGEQLISLEDIMQKYKEDYETIYEGTKDESADGRKSQEESETNDIKTNQKAHKKSFEELATQAIALKEPGFEYEKVEEALIEMDSEEIETAMMIFYKNYLVDAKTVFESCGEQIIQFLRPVDIRNLYNEGSITIENLKKAVRGMDEERAIHFICKTFPGNEAELETLIEAINMDIVEEEREKTVKNVKRDIIPVHPTHKSDIGISAIVNKYRFYESLDKDYSNTYYRNGFEVFELPNVKYENTEEPWIIIEPMIDKSHKDDKLKAAQDKAMWILPKSLWERQKETIIGSHYTIKTGRLRELYDSLDGKQMTKMHHVISNQEKVKEKEVDVEQGVIPRHGWPFRIIRKARLGKQYTEEEEKELLTLGLQLEKSMIRE